MGLILAWLYEKRTVCGEPVLFHSAANLTAMLMRGLSGTGEDIKNTNNFENAGLCLLEERTGGDTTMLSFASDYTEGACEEILQKLAETNRESLPIWHGPHARVPPEKIQEADRCLEAGGLFSGGRYPDECGYVISSMLAPYEGVVAAQTGHVSIHEAGAIEYTGHKVLQLPEKDGKIDPADLQEYLQNFEADANHDHMVFPGMVYLSHPTEYGTLYSRKELQAISEICRSYEIPLYLDGARLGYGLAGEKMT